MHALHNILETAPSYIEDAFHSQEISGIHLVVCIFLQERMKREQVNCSCATNNNIGDALAHHWLEEAFELFFVTALETDWSNFGDRPVDHKLFLQDSSQAKDGHIEKARERYA
jgi:hypothetical protein